MFATHKLFLLVTFACSIQLNAVESINLQEKSSRIEQLKKQAHYKYDQAKKWVYKNKKPLAIVAVTLAAVVIVRKSLKSSDTAPGSRKFAPSPDSKTLLKLGLKPACEEVPKIIDVSTKAYLSDSLHGSPQLRVSTPKGTVLPITGTQSICYNEHGFATGKCVDAACAAQRGQAYITEVITSQGKRTILYDSQTGAYLTERGQLPTVSHQFTSSTVSSDMQVVQFHLDPEALSKF